MNFRISFFWKIIKQQTKHLFAVALLALIFCGQSHALTIETQIEWTENPFMPRVTVVSNSIGKSWRVWGDQDADSVMLRNLTVRDAEIMVSAAAQSQILDEEITSSGGCADRTVRSGRLARISSGGDSMSFEVVCQFGSSQVHISMSDEYVVNHVLVQVPLSDFTRLTDMLIKELRK